MRVLTLLWILLAAAAVSACNTTRGFGEDVGAAGEGIQNAAEKAEEELEEAVD